MIYVDTSVLLAEALVEPRRESDAFWLRSDLVASRLTEYEAWVRLWAYGAAETHAAVLAERIGRLALVALDEAACARVRAPYATPARTLDALHLATADFLRSRGLPVRMATYDERLGAAALALGFPRWALPESR